MVRGVVLSERRRCSLCMFVCLFVLLFCLPVLLVVVYCYLYTVNVKKILQWPYSYWLSRCIIS